MLRSTKLLFHVKYFRRTKIGLSFLTFLKRLTDSDCINIFHICSNLWARWSFPFALQKTCLLFLLVRDYWPHHLLGFVLPFFATVSPPLIFRESNRFFILELAGSSFLFLRLFTPVPEVTEGRRSAANPHGKTDSADLLELRLRTSLFWRSQALSWQSFTKRSSCVALTFLLTFRVVSNGFWMYRAVVSGLVCSFPWWKGYKAGYLSLQTLKHTVHAQTVLTHQLHQHFHSNCYADNIICYKKGIKLEKQNFTNDHRLLDPTVYSVHCSTRHFLWIDYIYTALWWPFVEGLLRRQQCPLGVCACMHVSSVDDSPS